MGSGGGAVVEGGGTTEEESTAGKLLVAASVAVDWAPGAPVPVVIGPPVERLEGAVRPPDVTLPVGIGPLANDDIYASTAALSIASIEVKIASSMT